MKIFALSLVATLAVCSTSFAEEAKSNPDAAVKAMTGKDKTAPKKKAETCSSCGKKKSECNCHHEGGAHEHKEGEAGHDAH